MKWNQISALLSFGILRLTCPCHCIYTILQKDAHLEATCIFSKLKNFNSKLRIKYTNIYLQSILIMPRSSNWLLPFRLSNYKFLRSSPTSLIHAICHTYFIVLFWLSYYSIQVKPEAAHRIYKPIHLLTNPTYLLTTK